MPLKIFLDALTQYPRFTLSLRKRFLVSYTLVVLVGFALVDAIKWQIITPGAADWIDILSRFTCIVLLICIDSELVIQPLKTMEKTIKAFTNGDLDVRVSMNVIPELNRLGNSFNNMATSLQDVETRRRELTGDLAHELLSPVTALRLNLEMLESGIIQFSPELYSQSVQEVQRLERLVRDMLELSKIEAVYLPMQIATMDLRSLLEEMPTGVWGQTGNPNCDIHWQVPIVLPLVYADGDRVQQILVNLISNGIKYTPFGSITISAWVASPYLWISVTDTGIGIMPHHLPQVFDRFWRVNGAANSEAEGNGIGLAVAKRLVELQGGAIEVNSEPSYGSTFRFSLPLAI
jgi:signal transduction histidine kinase